MPPAGMGRYARVHHNRRPTGMGRYTIVHYNQVARNMNNYMVAYANPYYGYSFDPVDGFQPTYENLSDRFASGLYSLGFPDSIAVIGYYLGQIFDDYF